MQLSTITLRLFDGVQQYLILITVQLSIHLSIPYWLLTQNTLKKKTKLVPTFPQIGVTGELIFSSKGQMSGGRPHSMLANADIFF